LEPNLPAGTHPVKESFLLLFFKKEVLFLKKKNQKNF